MEPNLEVKTALASIQQTVETFAAQHNDLKSRFTQLQAQTDALDAQGQGRFSGEAQTKGIAEEIYEHPDFKHMGESGGRGRCVVKVADFQKKALTNTAAGIGTSGVLSVDRLPGIVGPQFRQLRIRDLLRSQPTTEASVDYVKVTDNGFVNATSPQVEGTTKGQSDLSLISVQSHVRTLASWVPCSKQIFQDLRGLEELINSTLLYGLKLVEERELLSGDGTGQHLLGLIPQATAFNSSLLPTGPFQQIDVIAAAIRQSERTDYAVDVIVLSVDDFWKIAGIKNSLGDYIFGNPSSSTVPMLWGRPVAVTNSITSGSFLIGASSTALIRDRLEAVIEISDSHADFFTANMLAIRCEERLALQVMRPAAWIYGHFSTSPA